MQDIVESGERRNRRDAEWAKHAQLLAIFIIKYLLNENTAQSLYFFAKWKIRATIRINVPKKRRHRINIMSLVFENLEGLDPSS